MNVNPLGPFPMTQVSIAQAVPTEPGAYVLGTNNRALYVSRADNLRARLLSHFGPPGPNSAPVQQFWYQIASNAFQAYILECTWFHQFSPTHNATHPTRPRMSLCP